MAAHAGTADEVQKDKEALVSIVKEMSESMTGAQSTRHWAEDALWFDIPAFASRGVQPALKFFDKVFGSLESCKVDILETDAVVSGNMGIVCTVQRVDVVLKNGARKQLLVRETDCFERRDNKWRLIHQHASVPSGGEWDGKIITEGSDHGSLSGSAGLGRHAANEGGQSDAGGLATGGAEFFGGHPGTTRQPVLR